MKETLEQIRREALAALSETKTAADLEALRVRYLGKKGELTARLKQMGKLWAEERPVMGQLASGVREALAEALARQQTVLEAAALHARLEAETLDVTIPGKPVEVGHKHPMYTVLDEIKDIFIGMGFDILDGPEIEQAEYNFTKLNAPEDHPSRDWTDTFYLTEDSSVLLRSQTSPFRSGPLRPPNCPTASFPPAGCSARTRWTPPTPLCFPRSRGWWWARASPLPT